MKLSGGWIALGLTAVGLGAAIYFIKPLGDDLHAPPLQPVSDAQATRLGEEFASALGGCHAEVLTALVDQGTMVLRAADAAHMSGPERLGFVHGAASESLTANMCKVGDDLTAELVRLRTVDGRPTPLIRTLGSNGLNYLELVLSKDARGTVRAVDIYPYMAGENMSASMASLARGAMSDGTGGILSGFDLERTNASIERALAVNDSAEVVRLIDALPAKVRDTKAFQLKRLQATAADQANVDGYARAITAFEQMFPGDPALDMVSIDGFILRADWPSALQRIDALATRVGGDPHLDAMRANVLGKSGDHRAAIAAARIAITAKPDQQDAWDALAEALARSGDVAAVAKTLDEMARRFHIAFDVDQLATLDFMRPFLASPEGKAWAAKVAP